MKPSPATPVQAANSGLPKDIGGCPILGVIGEGGQSVVYRGLHPRLQTEIAIKRLHPGLDSSESALVREALILSSSQSSALPRALDLQRVDGEWFLFLELIHGEPLTTAGDRLDSHQIVQLLSELLTALDELHASLLLHLDLSPANVLVDEGGRVRLIDFGLARRMPTDDGLISLGGTPGFAAPEVFEPGVRIDERADVYGAGSLLYFLLHGDAPGRASGRRPALRRGLQTDALAARLQTVCDGAIHVDRNLRFQSADEFQRALDAIDQRTSTSRRRLIAGMLAVALLLGSERRLTDSAHAEILVVSHEGERSFRGVPQLKLGDQIAFAFDASVATAGLMVRLPSGRVVRLEPFQRSPAGAFRYPPSGGTLLRHERGVYVVFFAADGMQVSKMRLQEKLESLPPPPELNRGECIVLSGRPGTSIDRDDSRVWSEAFLRCERDLPGLVAIAFRVE